MFADGELIASSNHHVRSKEPMPFDYKKEYKDIYQPSKKPAL